MTNETTASQPKSIGDDAQFCELLRDYMRAFNCDWTPTAEVDEKHQKFIAYIDSRAPAAQASATIQAAPELTKDVIEAVQWVTGASDVDRIPQPYAGAIFLLETFSEIGMTAKRDGQLTPNSLLCTKFANDLRLAATIQEPVMVAEPVGANINGPMTDAQKQHARHLYRNLHHLGPDAMEDVVRFASVCGYINGRKDFAEPAAPMVADPAGVATLEAEIERLKSDAVELEKWHHAKYKMSNEYIAGLEAKIAATVKAVPSEAPCMVVFNTDSQVKGCDWDKVPPGVYHVFAAPLADKTGGGE